MVRFCDGLYMTDNVRPKINRIKLKLISGIGTVGVNLITLSSNEKDVFDIYPAIYFKQKRLRRRDIYVIGVAESKKSAYKLVTSMILECIDNTGSFENIRDYYAVKFNRR